MTPEQLQKRKRIMQRSMALGHCICDPRKPCPCELFKTKGICECAGEKLPATSGRVRLTETVRSPGCSSKIGKRDLQEILAGLPDIHDPRVLVGRTAGDDAGVIMLDPQGQVATVLTVDVFSPSVDDPYTFGQIAAANSVSDVYAMGATPQTSLSIIGFPIHSLPAATLHEILKGGADKMAEAGITVIGGHSINDEEIKCGSAVVGQVPRDRIITNIGARAGDAVILTKPLGVAIVAFANQIGRAKPSSTQAIAASMSSLNRLAGTRMREFGASAATDVTGFSLLGHMAEVAKNSNALIEIDFDQVPLFPGVRDLACSEVIPGGVERNRESVPAAMLDLASLTPAQEAVLFCPETSGGLLVFLPQDRAGDFISLLHDNGVEAASVIGRVADTYPGGMIQARTASASAWATHPSAKAITARAKTAEAKPEAGCCCAGDPRQSNTAREGCCAEAQSPQPDCCNHETATATSGNSRSTPSGFLVPPAAGDAFGAYMQSVNQPGALGIREKKLIALALSVYAKCGPCVKIQTSAAKDAGATNEEIAEAVALGISFGGAPVNMFYRELMKG